MTSLLTALIIKFEESSLAIDEDAGVVNVCVVTSSNITLDRAVIVTLNTSDGTALGLLLHISLYSSLTTYFLFPLSAVDDYATINQQDLEFTNQNSRRICTEIPIKNDSILENNETFTAKISSSDVSVIIEDPSITIVIVDNDSELILLPFNQ